MFIVDGMNYCQILQKIFQKTYLLVAGRVKIA